MDARAHVVVAHYNEELEWCKNLPYPYTIISRNGIPANVPPNKGNEASSFLEYIINNYDSLSPYTIFVHGHRSAWHHMANMDERLKSLPLVHRYSCFNDLPPVKLLTLDWPGFVMKNITAGQEAAIYLERYMPQLSAILGPINMYKLIYKPCAQFYVSRDAICSRKKETYQQLYDFLMACPEPAIISGRIFEWLWHFIFTGDPRYRGD